MPGVTGIPGDDSTAAPCGLEFIVRGRAALTDDPPNGCCAKAETGTCENLDYAFASHGREQALQLPYKISDEVWVAVDGLDGLDQWPFTWFIQASHPQEQGLQVDEENLSGFLQGPAACSPELQDPHALCGQVVRPASGFGVGML